MHSSPFCAAPALSAPCTSHSLILTKSRSGSAARARSRATSPNGITKAATSTSKQQAAVITIARLPHVCGAFAAQSFACADAAGVYM